jgi:ABC-type methionine transport system ATPase subunit
MLITSYKHLTKKRQKRWRILMFRRRRRRRKTKTKDENERRKRRRSKRTVERRNNFQNKMCVSSQNKRVRKEEGATVDFVGHFVTLPFLSAAERSTGWTGSVLHGRIQTIGKLPLTTSNVLPSTPNERTNERTNEKRRRFSVSTDWLTFFLTNDISSKQMTNKWYKDAEESENRLKHKN